MTDHRSDPTDSASRTDAANQAEGVNPAPADRPLSILIAGDTFSPDVNGAAKFTEHLASGMAGRGHDVHVLCPAASRRHGTWTESYDGEKITAHRAPSYRWYPHDWLRFSVPWRARHYARKALDAAKPDVVHFQSAVIFGRAVAIEAEARGIRVIGTNHLMPENIMEHSLLPKALHDPVANLWWKDARKTYARASAVTTPTRRAAGFLERHGHVDHVLAISCGLKGSDYTPDFAEKPVQRILFVGRVTGEKHIDVLLRAVKLLPKDLPHPIELGIVGGGDQKANLEKLAQELGIADRTRFYGYVSDQELRALYTGSTVFAMPSVAELQSIATMEAMASGLPVVAANAMALPHLCHDGENGFLFEPGNERDLAEQLERILRLPQAERVEMAKRGLEMVQMHDIDRTLELFERLYRGESVADVAKDSVNEQDHSLDQA